MFMFDFIHLADPETSDYMIAGYIVIFSVMLAYVTSLFLRHRKLKQDLQTLQQMDDPFSKG